MSSTSAPVAHEHGLEIRVLGPVDIRVDGAPLVVDTRKAVAILVLLGVEGRPYARDELAAMLWPESDDESARGALRRTLSVLRAALGTRWVTADRSAVALDDDRVRVDLAELEAAAASGDHASLRRAASLARGPFLAGFSLRDSPDFDDWRATRAVAVERLVGDVLERLATTAEAAGDASGAIAAASRRLDLDPLDEPARRQLMAMLARAGDRAGAIRQYRAGVAVLERELGVAPLAETTDLYEAIRDAQLTSGGGERRPVGHAADRQPTGRGDPRPVVDAPRCARDPPACRWSDATRSSPRSSPPTTRRRHAAASRSSSARPGSASRGSRRRWPSPSRPRAAACSPRGPSRPRARSRTPRSSSCSAPASPARTSAAALAGLTPPTLREIERLVALPPEVARDLPAAPRDAGLDDQPAARARLLDAIATVLVALVAGDRSRA